MFDREYETHPIKNIVEKHLGGGTPSRYVTSYWEGAIPWASVKDFPESRGSLFDTEEHISKSGLINSASNLVPKETPLVCTRMAVGKTAWPTIAVAINQDIKALFPTADTDYRYLFRILQFAEPRAEALAVGSTVIGIRIEDYLNIAVPLANSSDQPVIGKVLDTLDTTIRETEAIIDKLKSVKRGLLHDLLTRGIDENGELRPSRSEVPTQYKESELGWVPIEWEVLPAEEVCEAVIDCKNRTPPETNSGHAVIRTPNVRGGRFVKNGLLFTDSHSYEIWTQRGKPRANDVLITREAPVGEACLLPEEIGPACLGQRMMMYRPDSTKMNSEFLLAALLSDTVQQRLLDLAGGSTVGHVKVGDIRNLSIPIPSPEEQAMIATRYFAFEEKVLSEEEELAKLLQLKSGLMDDLLTGRIRVTPLLDDLEDAP